MNHCVLINTVDYAKDMIGQMYDMLKGLTDEPFNQ